MARTAAAILLWVWILPFTESTDTSVTCTFSEDCILPCSFKPARDEVIHWNRNRTSVHTYYRNADHVEKQNQHFKGRTSLFKEQIKNGNASLLLRNCNIEDQGRYQCYTSTKLGNQDKLVNVKVHAPIQSVNIKKIGKEVICSSQGMYPAPSVSWTTDPPTQSDTLKDSTPTTQNPKGLYSVHSTVGMLGNVSDYAYICSVTSDDGMQKWTTSLRQQEILSENGVHLTIPCFAPGTFNPHNFTLKWTITRANKSEVILTFDSLTQEMSNHGNEARVDPEQVLSGNGSLSLESLENSAQTVTYTCEFSAFQIQHLVHTVITIPQSHKDDQGGRTHWLTAGIIVLLVLVIILICPKIFCQRNTPSEPVYRNGDTGEPRGHLGLEQPKLQENSTGLKDTGPDFSRSSQD